MLCSQKVNENMELFKNKILNVNFNLRCLLATLCDWIIMTFRSPLFCFQNVTVQFQSKFESQFYMKMTLAKFM